MRLCKKRKAARAREAAKKLARQTAEALLHPPGKPAGSGSWPLTQELEASVKGEDNSTLLEPDVTISVKQEPLELEVNPFQLEHLEEVKVELVDPMEGGPDPIGPFQLMPLEDAENVDQPAGELDRKPQDLPPLPVDLNEIRCQFCLKTLQEAGGRGAISRKKIVFVLSARKWGSPRERPSCCKGCKKMFDLFYDFKRSCLTALARPEFLLAFAGVNVKQEVKDLRPGAGTVPKKQRPKKSPTAKKARSANEKGKIDPDVGTANPESKPVDAESDIEIVDGVENIIEVDPNTTESEPNAASEAKSKPESKKKNKDRKYCYRCKQFFATEAIYTEHKPSCTKPARDPPPLACPKCPKRFNRPDKLAYHMNRHNGVRTVPCRREGCTKMFFDPNRRQQHETHCGQDVQVICSVCAAIFRSTGALRAHMPLHGDPTFACELCDKAFHTKAKLKKHSSVHSEERKFECKTCGKRFKSYEANRVHQRIHTQEKPYVCHICGMAFTYNCLLKTHLEKGHDQVQYHDSREELVAAARFIEMSSNYS